MMIYFTHPSEFVVECASVANGPSLVISPPKRRRRRLAIGANRPVSASRRLKWRFSTTFIIAKSACVGRKKANQSNQSNDSRRGKSPPKSRIIRHSPRGNFWVFLWVDWCRFACNRVRTRCTGNCPCCPCAKAASRSRDSSSILVEIRSKTPD